MRSKDLIRVLNSFFEKPESTILIDGPWGCGKTHQVVEFINRYKPKRKSKKPKIYYLTLFGKDNVDEINTELYRLVRPRRFRFKRFFSSGLQLISKVILPFNGISGLSNPIEMLSSVIRKETPKIPFSTIVVLDDLERVGSGFDFIQLMGYINSLIMNECKVICICDSNSMNKEMKENFHDFKEKIFDKIYQIDESEVEIMKSFFSNCNDTDVNLAIQKTFNKNIRTVRKTALLVNEIKNQIIKKGSSFELRISDYEIIKCSYHAVRICFDKHEDHQVSTRDSDRIIYRKFEFDSNQKRFGSNIALGIQAVADNNHLNSTEQYDTALIAAIIDIYIFDNPNMFFSLFPQEVKSFADENILEHNMFFLSDVNKQKFRKMFLEHLFEGKITFDSDNIQKFCDILRFSECQLTGDEIERITGLVYLVGKNGYEIDMEIPTTFLRLLKRVSEPKNTDVISYWTKLIEEKNKETVIKNEIEKIKHFFESGNLCELKRCIRDLKYSVNLNQNRLINKYIIENNFLLPDISQDVTWSTWNFALKMIDYAKTVKIENEFCELAKHLCRMNPDNDSLIERFNALIRRCIDEEYDLKAEILRDSANQIV